MSNNNFIVRKVAVLGAGVMGAQIAAHLVNANVETLLFELSAKQGDLNANVVSRGNSKKTTTRTVLDRNQSSSNPTRQLRSAS